MTLKTENQTDRGRQAPGLAMIFANAIWIAAVVLVMAAPTADSAQAGRGFSLDAVGSEDAARRTAMSKVRTGAGSRLSAFAVRALLRGRGYTDIGKIRLTTTRLAGGVVITGYYKVVARDPYGHLVRLLVDPSNGVVIRKTRSKQKLRN